MRTTITQSTSSFPVCTRRLPTRCPCSSSLGSLCFWDWKFVPQAKLDHLGETTRVNAVRDGNTNCNVSSVILWSGLQAITTPHFLSSATSYTSTDNAFMFNSLGHSFIGSSHKITHSLIPALLTSTKSPQQTSHILHFFQHL